MSIAQLARALRRGETTSKALTEAALRRLSTTGRKLGAVVSLTRGRALQEAARADRELKRGIDRGPLHGIPYAAKDLVAAAGYPTTWGAAPYRRQRFKSDADVIRLLADAGAVLTAKVATVELAGGIGYNQPFASFTGPVRSPWGKEAWAGGSSGGSAAAVGAGCVPFAIGTETLGSILQPAAFSGATGLRPTYGAISRRGVMALTWTMDKVGLFASTAADCALVLRHVAVTRPAPKLRIRPPFRFAVLATASASEPEVLANFEASLRACRQLGTFTTVRLGSSPWAEIASIIVRAEMASTFGNFIAERAGELTAPEARLNGLDALAISAETYINAQRARRQMCEELDSLLEPYDALLAPTMPFVATGIKEPFHAYYELDYDISLIMAGNLGGLPAVAIPNGTGARGLPTSLCLVARPYEDARLLAIASHVQKLIDHAGLTNSPPGYPEFGLPLTHSHSRADGIRKT